MQSMPATAIGQSHKTINIAVLHIYPYQMRTQRIEKYVPVYAYSTGYALTTCGLDRDLP